MSSALQQCQVPGCDTLTEKGICDECDRWVTAQAAALDDHYDDAEQDNGLDENGNILFECAAFWVDGGWFCPLQGSEECDWDCPHS